ALDPASLAGNNRAFLADPESVLGVFVVGDEDDCTLSTTEQDGEFVCHPVPLNSMTGSLKCSQPAVDICSTGDTGELDHLTPVRISADRIKALRGFDQTRLFVAPVAGPPAPAVPDCSTLLPEPSCYSPSSGSASPGNRFYEWALSFTHTLDA